MYEEFKIHLPVLRAYKDEKTGDMMFEGIASSTSVDSHETIFNEEAINGFMEDIADGISRGEPVELESEHNGSEEPFNILGPVISAEVIDNTKLRVVGRLDPDNSKAVYYYKKMTVADPITKKTKQFGLSINGMVVKAHYEYNQELGKQIRVFDRVKLNRVGIVRKPSNPDSWIEKLIRSVEWQNLEIKERSELKMEKDTNKEAVVEETETRNDNGNASDAATMVSEVADDVPTEEVRGDIVTEEDAVVAPAVEEIRDEKIADEVSSDEEKVEVVDRVSYWTSGTLLCAMKSVLSAVCDLEELTEYDAKGLNTGMTEEAIATAKECFAKLQAVLGEHVQTATERTEDASKEDLSNEVTQVTASKEVGRSEEILSTKTPSFDKGALVTEILDSFTGYLDNEFTEKLDRKFSDMLNEKFAKASEEKEELVRKIDEMSSANKELIERLEVVENSPASRPGSQLIEQIARGKDDFLSRKEVNIAKAKSESDTKELITHRLFPETYIGYGEYTTGDFSTNK